MSHFDELPRRDRNHEIEDEAITAFQTRLIRQEFEHGFEGMTSNPVSLDELLKAREDLIAEVSGKMPKEHREFLIGFKLGKPDWALLGVDGAAELPAVRWKQINLDKLRAADREKLVAQLIAVLK
ncbi:hypothetical protein PMN64_37430 [Bradyrhizobium sp. UFLA01-814]|uniref:hypothetical protein n=1 Tax=Bradyrhizobium sp. UFLA01-814 TaxID=3023480 RepID=UPI00398A5722